MPINPNPLNFSPRRGLTTPAVSTRPNNSKTSRRSLSVTSPGRFPTQISILFPFPWHRTPILGGRAKQRQQTREMGLEAGKASVTHGRPSRLHPAIILSSEQHATDAIVPPVAASATLFYFFLQNIFNSSGAEENSEQVWANRLFSKQRRALRGIRIDTYVFRMGFL